MKPLESAISVGTNVDLARLVHEIGNPLNGMDTTIQLLEKQLSENGGECSDVMASSLRNLRGEIDRLRSILWEIRSLSEINKINPRPADLPTIVDEVLKLESPQHVDRGITVVKDWVVDIPTISADPEKLKQALLNLFKNAFEAMPKGGVLKVRGFPRGEWVVLEIADTGTGIPKDMPVFRPLSSAKPKGMGLGLTIVRQIILAHGGTISFKSKPEKGTVFRLKFPRGLSQESTKMIEVGG